MKNKVIIIGIVFVLLVSFLGLTSAEKINIDLENNYIPGENIDFKIILYNDNNEKIDGFLDFKIQNYYTDIVKEGKVSSGEIINFELPENSVRGLWKITAYYESIEKEGWFNVIELEKAEIKLQRDNLIVTNVGNIPYRKPISIGIGDHYETALIGLEVGQTKQIKLTAPEGNYDISVSDGTEENTFDIRGVPLTGNVIGLEGGVNGFWKRYPMVGLFLGVLMLVVLVIFGLKAYKKFSG